MKDPNHLALQILRASKPSRFEIFLQDFKEEKSLWLYQNCYINSRKCTTFGHCKSDENQPAYEAHHDGVLRCINEASEA